MENAHFLEEKDLTIEKERPTFLTVLCIITFVISGFLLLYTVFRTITYDEAIVIQTMETQIAEMESSPELVDNAMAKSIADGLIRTSEEEIANYTLFTIISFLSLIMSLAGAYLMYHLKKTGFYLYTFSKLIALAPLFIYMITMVVGIWYVLIVFFSAVFIFMYARNLKYLA